MQVLHELRYPNMAVLWDFYTHSKCVESLHGQLSAIAESSSIKSYFQWTLTIAGAVNGAQRHSSHNF